MCICKEKYCKELALVIMEANKSQGLQGGLASWGPRRTGRVVPAPRLAGSRFRGNQRLSSCLRQGGGDVAVRRLSGRRGFL